MADRVENNIVNSLNKAFNGVKFADNNDKMLALSSMKNSIVDSELEEGDEVFIDMKKKVESKEATGAASAGSYVGPAFMSTDVEDTETKTKTKQKNIEYLLLFWRLLLVCFRSGCFICHFFRRISKGHRFSYG